jgi:hypothetical protein
MRPLLLPAFLAFTAAVLPPNASIGQDAGFGRDADVHVREGSFACKETSELDRLLQRNQSGGFTSGVQLYEYLQSHNCIGLSAGRVRVYATHAGAHQINIGAERVDHFRILRHRADQQAGAGVLEELPNGDGRGQPERDQEQPVERKRLVQDDDDAAEEIGNAGDRPAGPPRPCLDQRHI